MSSLRYFGIQKTLMKETGSVASAFSQPQIRAVVRLEI